MIRAGPTQLPQLRYIQLRRGVGLRRNDGWLKTLRSQRFGAKIQATSV